MAIPVQSILSRFKTVLNDSDSVRWTEAEFLLWVNEFQQVAAETFEDACVKTQNLTLSQGALQTLPSDGIKILDIPRNVAGGVVTKCDRSVMDRFDPTWVTKERGSSVMHWMDDAHPDKFWVYPAQGSTPGSVVVTHTAYPTAIASTAGNLGVRDTYADNAVNYCLARAYAKDAEFGGNAALASEYLKLALG